LLTSISGLLLSVQSGWGALGSVKSNRPMFLATQPLFDIKFAIIFSELNIKLSYQNFAII
ncbi:MAG: hypothetical protein ACKO7W_00815, partial [Elainella sp.]